jgi:hypothetical protein
LIEEGRELSTREGKEEETSSDHNGSLNIAFLRKRREEAKAVPHRLAGESEAAGRCVLTPEKMCSSRFPSHPKSQRIQ